MRGTAPQVRTSIPPTPHTAVQAASGFCLPEGRHFLPGGPILLGSTPRVQGSGLTAAPHPPCWALLSLEGGLTFSPSELCEL